METLLRCTHPETQSIQDPSIHLSIHPSIHSSLPPKPSAFMNILTMIPLSPSTLISLLTLKRGMVILTTLKIQKESSSQDSNISISTSHTITLKRDTNHHKMHQLQTIQTRDPYLISWI
jgi:hypothetical protein